MFTQTTVRGRTNTGLVCFSSLFHLLCMCKQELDVSVQSTRCTFTSVIDTWCVWHGNLRFSAELKRSLVKCNRWDFKQRFNSEIRVLLLCWEMPKKKKKKKKDGGEKASLSDMGGSVWGPWDCHKSPYTRWLKTTGIYPLTVLKVRNLKSRHWRRWSVLEAQRESSAIPRPPAPGDGGAAGRPWSLAYRCAAPVSASVSTGPFPLLFRLFSVSSLDTGYWIWSPAGHSRVMSSQNPQLNDPWKDFFQIFTCTGPGSRTYLFGGSVIQIIRGTII